MNSRNKINRSQFLQIIENCKKKIRENLYKFLNYEIFIMSLNKFKQNNIKYFNTNTKRDFFFKYCVCLEKM